MSEIKTLPERSGVSVVNRGEQDDLEDVCISYNKYLEHLGDGMYSYPITVVDEYMDWGRFESINVYGLSFGRNGSVGAYELPLSKRKMWDEVIEILEENCVRQKKTPRALRSSRMYQTRESMTYSLPIIGQKDFNNEAIQLLKKKNTIFKWMGHSYSMDDEIVYVVRKGGRLTSVGSYKYVELKGVERLVGDIKAQGVASDCNYMRSFIKPANATWKNDYFKAIVDKKSVTHSTTENGRVYHDTNHSVYKRFIEVDFGENTEVTHVSTMGRPVPYHVFPRDIKERQKHGSIRVCDDRNFPREYITKYAVWAKVKGGKTWENIGRFTGNNDVFNEVCHEFADPIHAQKIRIVPISYSNALSFRVSLFGPTKTEIKEQEPTVEYTVIYPSKCRYKIKGGANEGWMNEWRNWGNSESRKDAKRQTAERLQRVRKGDMREEFVE